jgi:myo-inositol-1(or 4)-monophosphatase
MEIQALKHIGLEATLEAGALLKAHFGRKHLFESKTSQADIVTEFDHRSEELVFKKIHQHFPDHDFLTEEKNTQIKKSDFRWILDPIDGTTNFAHGFPFFCVALGLEYKKEMLLGFVYLPTLNELFFAERNNGATLNNSPIKISESKKLSNSLLIGSSPHDRDLLNANIKLMDRFIRESQNVLRIGSAAVALCYLAAGRIDGYWALSLQPWDLAAASLIVKEAGGTITNFENEPIDIYGRQTLSTNGKIHADMRHIILEETRTKGA